MYRHFQHLTLKFLSCAFLYREEEEDPSTQHPLENRWKQWRQTVCRTDVATSPDSKPATCIQNTNKKNLINSSPVLFFYIYFFILLLGERKINSVHKNHQVRRWSFGVISSRTTSGE